MAIDILKIAREYTVALATGKSGGELAQFFSTGVEQTEYPNRLNPSGGVSGYQTLIERSQKGKYLIDTQTFDIQREYVCGNTVILEIVWTASFKVPFGQLAPGQPMKAFFGVFMEFIGDKIIRQRNYDCFEPF